MKSTETLIKREGWNDMKPLILSVLLSSCFVLCGCASLGLPNGDVAGQAILKDLQGCDRHYEGAIGAGVNGSFKIDCKAAPATAPT